MGRFTQYLKDHTDILDPVIEQIHRDEGKWSSKDEALKAAIQRGDDGAAFETVMQVLPTAWRETLAEFLDMTIDDLIRAFRARCFASNEPPTDAKLEQEVSDVIFEHLDQHESWVVEHPTSVDPNADPSELHVIWYPHGAGADEDPVCVAVRFERIL